MESFEDFFFVNNSTGFIIGHSSIYKTTNTVNWVIKSTDAVQGKYLEDIYFVNSSTGWIVGYGYLSGSYEPLILHTSDGGETWENQVLNESISLLSVDFIDNNNGWVAGSNGRVVNLQAILTLYLQRILTLPRHPFSTISQPVCKGYFTAFSFPETSRLLVFSL